MSVIEQAVQKAFWQCDKQNHTPVQWNLPDTSAQQLSPSHGENAVRGMV